MIPGYTPPPLPHPHFKMYCAIWQCHAEVYKQMLHAVVGEFSISLQQRFES